MYFAINDTEVSNNQVFIKYIYMHTQKYKIHEIIICKVYEKKKLEVYFQTGFTCLKDAYV